MNKNQKGFSAVEGLLILVIVGILGFVGWYVWHSKNSSDTALNNAANTSSSSAAKTTKFTFKEIGVSVNLPDSLRDLKYTIYTPSGAPAGAVYMYIEVPAYKDTLTKICSPDTTGGPIYTFANLTKIIGKFTPDPAGYPGGSGILKQFDDFYLFYNFGSGAPCDYPSDAFKASNITKLQNDFKNAFKTATLETTLTINEWGLKLNTGDTLKQLSYTMKEADTLVFMSNLQKDLPSVCTPAWGIVREASGKIVAEDGTPMSDGAADKIPAYKHFGSYYYHRYYPQTGCEQAQQLMTQIDTAYKNVFNSLTNK